MKRAQACTLSYNPKTEKTTARDENGVVMKPDRRTDLQLFTAMFGKRPRFQRYR